MSPKDLKKLATRTSGSHRATVGKEREDHKRPSDHDWPRRHELEYHEPESGEQPQRRTRDDNLHQAKLPSATDVSRAMAGGGL
jgi:hypothetical protein